MLEHPGRLGGFGVGIYSLEGTLRGVDDDEGKIRRHDIIAGWGMERDSPDRGRGNGTVGCLHRKDASWKSGWPRALEAHVVAVSCLLTS
jgi:hypothetical protein